MSDDDSTSPLWKFATDHALVFGAEVLTKLNEFEVKIFYDLCRASREVVIRSKIELNNERRYVIKVKSMQELALAWEYYRWGEEDMFGLEMTQELFCARVAMTKNLDFLKWARVVKQCALMKTRSYLQQDLVISKWSSIASRMIVLCMRMRVHRLPQKVTWRY